MALRLITLLLFIILTGCSIKHDYVWNEYQIAPAKWTEEDNFEKGQVVTLIEGRAETSENLLGSVGAHEYYGSLQTLTHGIVEHLALELRKKLVVIKDSAEKTLEITVDSSAFERGMWKIAATINYTVKFGNGNSKSFTVRNSSPATVDRTYNGVIANAVIQIIKDPEVRQYLME
jgi:hypothetical protein